MVHCSDATVCTLNVNRCYRLNQSKLIHVNTVIVKVLKCNVFKKTNSFCDVIEGRSSSTCGHGKY